ncbi:MAG: hypothetical protein NC548_36030 [Lachnospiraceae bacterium]|nr:hypothetical protein [Lachnospiraceae bacterium]
MVKNEELQAKIEELEKSIQVRENQRMRSIAAIVGALVDKVEPNETEVKIFKLMSQIIENECNELRLLKDQLNVSE